MTKRTLLVTFNFAGPGKSDELEPVFNKALDWIRYAPNCWLVWTSKDPNIWYRRLKPFLATGDHLLVVEVNLAERAGWLPRSVWDWINQERAVHSEP